MPRLVCISDTHTLHAQLTPFIVEAKADILIHCGDFCKYHGDLSEVGLFADWCAMLLKKGYVKHILVVAGNHDEVLDETCPATKRGWGEAPRMAVERLRSAGVRYLQDSEVQVEGLIFYGVPWVKECGDFGFQWKSRGEEERIFNHVRAPIDILLTHSPPFGVMDSVVKNIHGDTENIGSQALLRAIMKVRPRLHIFGHVHSQHGLYLTSWGTLCVNAASLDGENRIRKDTRRPIVIDVGV